LATDLGGLAAQSWDLFLFRVCAVTRSVVLQIARFKMSEPPELGQFDVLDLTNVAAYGFVEIDDLPVGNWKGTEKLKHVLGVLPQLTGAVREGTEDGHGGGIPGNGPVPVGLDNFGRLAASD
jgi:hypothetical protein